MAERPPVTPPMVPDDWSPVSALPPGALWAARRPADADDGFAANLVVTCDDVGGMSFRDWQVGTDQVLPRMLDDFLLVDLARIDLDGHPGGRRLAHHVVAGVPVTMEQWFTLADDRGWTLTATVDTWQYDELADLLTQVAASWRPVSGARAVPDAD